MKRVRERDRELFPTPVFNWDRKRYGDELMHQMELAKKKKELEKTRQIYLEKKMLEENEERYRLNQLEYEKNAQDLRNTIYNMMNRQDTEPEELPKMEPIIEEVDNYEDVSKKKFLKISKKKICSETDPQLKRMMKVPDFRES